MLGSTVEATEGTKRDIENGIPVTLPAEFAAKSISIISNDGKIIKVILTFPMTNSADSERDEGEVCFKIDSEKTTDDLILGVSEPIIVKAQPTSTNFCIHLTIGDYSLEIGLKELKPKLQGSWAFVAACDP